ncbi:protein FREE1 isoform X2 [Dendrobium catenatum]|uniref:1-phosphatidylinositol-3-phosphate 5-kinase FAB1A n=1 Tax=Dendrobium catenatum TaxID=906689 RepID=A0A2I0X875_9ASPA|nr:protein FREE1 isoform X2 [Dendrobium catenatum]PKU84118.1 1-phosphatidylinositol-3-phosphate 5-kinase FAB1A [Dendrobium catenatum]
MQQGSDFGSQYYAYQYPPSHPNPNPTPNPNEFAPPNSIHPSYASAPPFSHYSSSMSASTAPYPPFSQHADPIPTVPPSAPSYSQPQSQSQDAASQYPPYANYSSSLFQPELSSSPALAPYSNLQQPSSAPYHSYDSHHNYNLPNPNPDPTQRSDLTPPVTTSVYAPSETTYQGGVPRFDHGVGYYNDNSGKYDMNAAGSFGQSRPGYDQDFYEKRPEREFQYGHVSAQDDGLGEGVYAYDGGRSEPYGARGTLPRSSSSSAWGGFDDYGRSTSFSSGRGDQVGSAGKIVRAVPKAEAQQDVKSGVQKFRVKLLPEGTNVNTTDVLCQIGLDGIRMLDPSTSRTLRIYPLENVTRWEVLDSSIFCFWSKSSVDIEPKRIRLKSNSYTTTTILDTVTAASVQLKEMGGSDVGRSRVSADGGKPSEQANEKKKGLADWMNKMKPGNEEKDHWVPDEAVSQCTSCAVAFGPFVRRHHCRNCGDIFCDKCSQGRTALTTDENAQLVRVCDGCMAEVTQNLSIAKEAGNRSAVSQTHEDLARKLQEEMERNRKPSSDSKLSDSSGKKMREVACPICTVHLQVQVPNSGSETIECGVCQNPFLVSAH